MQTPRETQLTAPRHTTTLTTNLYEVCRILQDEMAAADDATIVATVLYLLRSGQMKFLHNVALDLCDDSGLVLRTA